MVSPSDVEVRPVLSGFVVLTLALTLLGSALLLAIPKSGKRRKLPPGPTAWPIVGNLLDLSHPPFRRMTELSKTYGPLMRLWMGSKLLVVVSSSELAKEVLQTHDRVCASRPSTVASRALTNDGRDIILAPFGPFWRNSRKLMIIHTLSANKIQSYLPKALSILHSMKSLLIQESDFSGGILEIRPIVFQGLIVSSMFQLFGKEYKLTSSKDAPQDGDRLIELVDEASSIFSEINPCDFISFLSHTDILKVGKRSRILSKNVDLNFGKLIDERIELRKTISPSPEDRCLVDVLIDQDEELSKSDMAKLCGDFLIAGVETSAFTVEWALAELITHPEKMEKLKDELKEVDIFSPATDFFQLPYLQAVIKETLRLHTILPLLLPHFTLEDVTLNGYTIPKDTIFFINLWAIAHDPNIWPDPMAFHPERFLDSDVNIRGFDFRLIPFGAGRRMCPGMNLGLSWVNRILSLLIQQFQWKLPNGVSSIDFSDNYKSTLSMAKPLRVEVVAAQA